MWLNVEDTRQRLKEAYRGGLLYQFGSLSFQLRLERGQLQHRAVRVMDPGNMSRNGNPDLRGRGSRLLG